MPRRHCFLVLLQATSRWRALDADARDAHHDAMLMHVFEAYPDLTLRHFEGIAMGVRCSDVLWWETCDASQYHDAMRSLRDAGLLEGPYFELVDAIPLIEQTAADAPMPAFLASSF